MLKSPADLRVVLRRQWENANYREARLLGTQGAWPISLSIGRPTSRMVRDDLDTVKRHIEAWRKVSIGEVITEQIPYRIAAEPISIPIAWQLSKPSEWIEATGDRLIRSEFETLGRIVQGANPMFHSLLLRKRSLWSGRSIDEVIVATKMAMRLEPGCAEGRPLRTFTIEGIDTKFFERNASLITALLDVRYEGEVSQLGLGTFLNAFQEGEHWLLMVDLDGGLLPFQKMRVRSSELRERQVAGSRLILIENESCQHHLPPVTDAIAILGTGFDLTWTDASWLAEKQVAYWGDIDTWGLQFLAKARTAIPHLEPLMMTEQVFDQYQSSAVCEPVIAGSQIPEGLLPNEAKLYAKLLESERGRLEQEFLPIDHVQQAIAAWTLTSDASHMF
ncbi:Wadjet anti-phage system protein JetD domain-containing protein [Pirellulaceae bacterium SH449]